MAPMRRHAYGLFHHLQGRAGDAWRGLGSVLLAVTGSEALYADMGHFSANAIRVSECHAGGDG